MRLKANRVKDFYLRPLITGKDREGSTYSTYGEPVKFSAEEWPGGGAVQSQMYGEKLPNIRNMRINGSYTEKTDPSGKIYFQVGDTKFSPGDGICYSDSDHVDYRIAAIYPYSFLTIEVEHL